MEPEDEALHSWRAQRDLSDRPAQDPERGRVRLLLRPGPRRRRRHDPVRRDQEADPGPRGRVRGGVRDALRQPALARRHVDEFRHGLGAGQAHAGTAGDAGGRRLRGHAQAGGAAAHPRAREAESQPGRDCRPGPAPQCRVRDRHQEGAHRRHRGAQARSSCGRRRGHQLRPRRDRLCDSRQRRCDPIWFAHVPRDGRRRRGGALHRRAPAPDGAGRGGRGGQHAPTAPRPASGAHPPEPVEVA